MSLEYISKCWDQNYIGRTKSSENGIFHENTVLLEIKYL